MTTSQQIERIQERHHTEQEQQPPRKKRRRNKESERRNIFSNCLLHEAKDVKDKWNQIYAQLNDLARDAKMPENTMHMNDQSDYTIRENEENCSLDTFSDQYFDNWIQSINGISQTMTSMDDRVAGRIMNNQHKQLLFSLLHFDVKKSLADVTSDTIHQDPHSLWFRISEMNASIMCDTLVAPKLQKTPPPSQNYSVAHTSRQNEKALKNLKSSLKDKFSPDFVEMLVQRNIISLVTEMNKLDK